MLILTPATVDPEELRVILEFYDLDYLLGEKYIFLVLALALMELCHHEIHDLKLDHC